MSNLTFEPAPSAEEAAALFETLPPPGADIVVVSPAGARVLTA
ncbi:hypothetical protein [Actinoplanes sp. TBRC 11911]|nr:hypothetical protein [Actinoplanes sp. TBRC 11911]